MMNKPTVLSTGEWLLPACSWFYWGSNPDVTEAEKGANVISSSDQGKTWRRLNKVGNSMGWDGTYDC